METPWPANLASSLGVVQALSHPTGPIGAIAADVATRQRAGFSISRLVSYSEQGRARTPGDRLVGARNCDFVGYTDGKAHYIESTNTVFSKDFSGCTMVVYRKNGMRRVAHVAASAVPAMNCKQAFMETIQNDGAQLIGWFKPFTNDDNQRKINTFMAVTGYIADDIKRLTTFGIITDGNVAYSLDAFKPVEAGLRVNEWVVTHVRQHELNRGWVVT